MQGGAAFGVRGIERYRASYNGPERSTHCARMTMRQIRKATVADVPGISRGCSAGYGDTYPGLLTDEEIEATVVEWYSLDHP